MGDPGNLIWPRRVPGRDVTTARLRDPSSAAQPVLRLGLAQMPHPAVPNPTYHAFQTTVCVWLFADRLLPAGLPLRLLHARAGGCR